MKRMVAGAVSDIPAHNLPINPRVYLDTQVLRNVQKFPEEISLKKNFLVCDKGSFSSGGLLGLCDGSRQLCVDVPLRVDGHLR